MARACAAASSSVAALVQPWPSRSTRITRCSVASSAATRSNQCIEQEKPCTRTTAGASWGPSWRTCTSWPSTRTRSPICRRSELGGFGMVATTMPGGIKLALIAAAAELFVRAGVRGATIEAIAQDGVVRPTGSAWRGALGVGGCGGTRTSAW